VGLYVAFYQSLRSENRYPRGRDKPGQAGWIADRLLRLRALLNGKITSKRRPNSLIIGSWNIRHFDGGRPRLPESFHYIAEIIDHFDICAIQEVKNIESMERLQHLLGPNWDYFINDSSGAGRGNHERMAFKFGNTGYAAHDDLEANVFRTLYLARDGQRFKSSACDVKGFESADIQPSQFAN
jgi:hypothetical protein